MNTKKNNFDPLELAKFEALASRWWDPEGEFGALHNINPLRLEWIKGHTNLSKMRIVDIGCGGGILTEPMSLLGADVVGIDLADASLEIARLHQHESNTKIDYKKISAEEFANKEPNSFDIVTCLEMLEHVPDPSSIIESCATLVKPGGYVFFSTINRNLKSFLFAILGAEYILKLLPAGTHQFEKFIKPSELDSWSRKFNLSLIDSIGMQYNPITKQYSLGDNLEVNYLMVFQREKSN
tara:strand:+ start:1049 stop:1765 length:717 start_codon:yes stop_codon:yes gene_type:complete